MDVLYFEEVLRTRYLVSVIMIAYLLLIWQADSVTAILLTIEVLFTLTVFFYCNFLIVQPFLFLHLCEMCLILMCVISLHEE